MKAHQLMHEVILLAFKNQDTLNQRLDPEWHLREFPYYRAIWTEAAEASEHTNWLWWKAGQYKQPESDAQIQDVHVEMCDILHFGMSMDIEHSRNGHASEVERLDYHARMYAHWFAFEHPMAPKFHSNLEEVVVSAITLRQFDMEHFAMACRAVKLSLPALLILYFAKSTLNQFRWDNGYNLPAGSFGKYSKMWKPSEGMGDKPVEDNVYLSSMVSKVLKDNAEDEILQALHDGSFKTQLYNWLEKKYMQHCL